MVEQNYSNSNRPFLRYSMLAVTVVLVALFSCFAGTMPIHASSDPMMEEPDTSSLSGDDMGGDENDQTLFDDNPKEAIALTEKPSFGSINVYTPQGTKAQTLRSRTVYIVNGKKQIRK